MDTNHALIAFDALSQETRLNVFKLLVKYANTGLPAGKIGETLGVPHNTLSFHLTHLSNAGLVKSRREGRSIIYTAHMDHFTALIDFMIKDCCSGQQSCISTKEN